MRRQIAEDQSQPASSLLHFDADTDALEVLSLCGGVSGDDTLNFAKAEMFPRVMKHYATRLVENPAFEDIRGSLDCLCAVSVGSIKFATHLAALCDCRDIYLERRVTSVATEISFEESFLIARRHGIEKGMRYGLVDDIIDFPIVDEATKLITGKGGIVVGVFGVLNCSPDFTTRYKSQDGTIDLPIISVKRDPRVVLMEAMAK